MSEQHGVKELVELVNGVEVLAVMGAKMYADKKLGYGDLTHLFEAVKNMGVLLDAAKGLDKVKDELKDLDGEEAKKVLAELAEVWVKAKAELNKDEMLTSRVMWSTANPKRYSYLQARHETKS